MWSPADMDTSSSVPKEPAGPPRVLKNSSITAAGITTGHATAPIALPHGLVRAPSTSGNGLAPSPNVFSRSLSFALASDWPPPVVDSEGLIRGFSEWSMSSLDGPADEQEGNAEDQGELLADLKAMLDKSRAEHHVQNGTATSQPLQCSNSQGPAPAWASRGSSVAESKQTSWNSDGVKPVVPNAPSWGLPAGAVVNYNSDKVGSDDSDNSAVGVNENLSSSSPAPTHISRPSRKKKTRSGERCGADIEKKRLKKNAREQRRATKINDQINILKNILEQNTGMQVLNTKSSILSDTITLLQNMLKGQPHIPPPQAYAPADQMLLEPYYMLFRKSATPLAIAKADSTGQFLDCNNRFSEIFGFAAEQLADRTAYSITSQQDLELTSRLLNTVMVNPALDDGTGEVIFTTSDESRILVKVSALKDENRRPLYLLFTPRAVIKPPEMMQSNSNLSTSSNHSHGSHSSRGHA